MAVLGVSSITPAFPKIITVFSISTQKIGLLITIFTLPGLILTPVLGVLADRYGRKRILIPSLFLFGIAGGACALVRDFHLLLTLRFFQGIGAAALGSLNVTLIGDLYAGKERTAMMGYNASVLSVGTASYPFIGGAMALLGWYYPFFLPLVAIPIGIIVIIYLKNPEPESTQHLKHYLREVWKNVYNRHVAGLFIASVIVFIILYGSFLTYLPVLMGKEFKSSSLVIGMVMSAMSISTAITSSRLRSLTRIFSEKGLIQLSCLFYALGLVLFPLMHKMELLFIPAIIFGLGHGVNFPSIQSLLAGMAPMKYRGAFMSLNGMVLRLGQTLGPLVMGFVFLMSGIDATFYAGGFFALLMLLLVAWLV